MILEVDRAKVDGGLDTERALRKAGAKALLLVLRDDATLYFAVPRDRDH